MNDKKNLNLPDDLLYTADHEWAKVDGDSIKVGITDYAQEQLGDIVFVELPESGTSIEKGEEFGSIESVKAVAEIYMPVSGEITAVNELLSDTPERLNEDAYDTWIIEVKVSDTSQIKELLSKNQYLDTLEG